MGGYLLFIIHNAIVFALVWFTINKCLDPKLRWKSIFLIELASVVAYNTFSVTAAAVSWLDAIRPLLIAACYFTLTILMFRGKLLRKLLVVTAAYIAAISTEIVIYLLFPSATVEAHFRSFSLMTIWWYVVYLCTQAILLYLVYLLLHRKSINNIDRLSARQYWFFLFFPISQYLLLSVWFLSFGERISRFNLIFLIVAAAICFFADVVWFREMSRIADAARLKAENDLLEKQVSVQREYYETLSSNYADMSAMRHDIANHIYTIRVLLQDGKSDEAIRYAAELEQRRPVQSILSSCKNSVVHSFLRHKLEELKEKEITADFDVTLTPDIGIPDTDLIIALGNLLDNAAEASLAAEKHTIRLQVVQKDGYIHIETENSCPVAPIPKRRKVAYLSRGIGTSILQSLAEQYRGSYISANESNTNHAVLILQEKPLC